MSLEEREVEFFDGEILMVECERHRSYAATRETPAEGGLSAVNIYWRGIEISKVLTPDEIADIEEKL
jgi:hypothetical protein